jgi:hypothetical protein
MVANLFDAVSHSRISIICFATGGLMETTYIRENQVGMYEHIMEEPLRTEFTSLLVETKAYNLPPHMCTFALYLQDACIRRYMFDLFLRTALPAASRNSFFAMRTCSSHLSQYWRNCGDSIHGRWKDTFSYFHCLRFSTVLYSTCLSLSILPSLIILFLRIMFFGPNTFPSLQLRYCVATLQLYRCAPSPFFPPLPFFFPQLPNISLIFLNL